MRALVSSCMCVRVCVRGGRREGDRLEKVLTACIVHGLTRLRLFACARLQVLENEDILNKAGSYGDGWLDFKSLPEIDNLPEAPEVDRSSSREHSVNLFCVEYLRRTFASRQRTSCYVCSQLVLCGVFEEDICSSSEDQSRKSML